MKNTTFILCLNLFIVLFSSTIAGYIFAYTKYSFYKIYNLILIGILSIQLVEIPNNIIFNSLYKKLYINIFVLLLTFFLLVLKIKEKKMLALTAVLEECIYRIVAVPVFMYASNSKILLIIVVSLVFMINHIYIILKSANIFVSLMILFMLNLILILMALYIDIWICPLIHLLYDLAVMRQQQQKEGET